MKLKALTSFAGKISMYAGEVREVADEAIAHDLIKAGHAEAVVEKVVVKPAPQTSSTAEAGKNTSRKRTRRKK